MFIYIPVLRAALPCTRKKILALSGTFNIEELMTFMLMHRDSRFFFNCAGRCLVVASPRLSWETRNSRAVEEMEAVSPVL